jgi:segregation and condensation protein B
VTHDPENQQIEQENGPITAEATQDVVDVRDDLAASAVPVPETEPDITDRSDGDAGEGPSLSASIEAILLVVDEPVSVRTLAQVLQRPAGEVERALEDLSMDYQRTGRGFELRSVAGGWRLYTHPDCAAVVERFVVDGQQARLTQAALETLAVIAYRQPVSRSKVSAVRGVNVDGVIKTLVGRALIEECGSEPESGALLYRTTSVFLERVGLENLDQLPDLAPMLPNLETLDFNIDVL